MAEIPSANLLDFRAPRFIIAFKFYCGAPPQSLWMAPKRTECAPATPPSRRFYRIPPLSHLPDRAFPDRNRSSLIRYPSHRLFSFDTLVDTQHQRVSTKRKSRPRYRPRREDAGPAQRTSARHKSGQSVRKEQPQPGATPPEALPSEPLGKADLSIKAIAAALLAIAFFWSYWPTLTDLVYAWETEPDYSHGYLVVPLAIFFLYVRRDRFPGLAPGLCWAGLLPLAFAAVMRLGSAAIYLDALDGWSIPLWTLGAVWLVAGDKAMRWALPAVGFLVFMVPLPFGAEHLLSQPLQGLATKLSCYSLQCLGQPALAEGNTIWLGDIHLQVEEACSGLRIFMGIVALAYACLVLTRRPWWIKAMLLAATLPIALAANATRIVVTGLLWRNFSGELAHTFSHDFAGWTMIPLAALLFAATAWYLGKLFRESETLGVGSVLRRDQQEI